MTLNEIRKGYTCNNIILLVSSAFLSSSMGLTLMSCSATGDEGGPAISSLSAPTDTTTDATSDSTSNSSEAQQADQEDGEIAPSPDATAGVSSASISDSDDTMSLPLPSYEDAMSTTPQVETGATVSTQVTWNPSSDTDTAGYYVYYGKQPSGELGSCSYDQSQPVEAPPATITGLDPNTPYYFAISAFNEAESPCSIEIMIVTPPANS